MRNNDEKTQRKKKNKKTKLGAKALDLWGKWKQSKQFWGKNTDSKK